MTPHIPATPPPTARATDPVTSHAAADSVRNITETHHKILALFDRGPMTDGDLAKRWRSASVRRRWDPDAPVYQVISESGLRTRRRELVDAGLLVDTGEYGTTESGRKAIVWGLA